MTRCEYRLVDVFTDKAFGGNPLAVFRDPGKLDVTTMQAIAKELHLSETTFVLPPTSAAADHRVRMFTPDAELPFAGHPTIGTAFVLADGKDGALRLEAGVGVIGVTLRDGFVQMEQPLPAFTGTTITRKAVRSQVSESALLAGAVLSAHAKGRATNSIAAAPASVLARR